MMTSKAFTLFLPIYTLFHSIYTVSSSLFSISESQQRYIQFLKVTPTSIQFFLSAHDYHTPPIYMFAMQECKFSMIGQNGSCDGCNRIFNNQQSLINIQINTTHLYTPTTHIAIYLHVTHTQPPAFYHPLAWRSTPIQVDVQGHDLKWQTKWTWWGCVQFQVLGQPVHCHHHSF